jgi:hypothetical protein
MPIYHRKPEVQEYQIRPGAIFRVCKLALAEEIIQSLISATQPVDLVADLYILEGASDEHGVSLVIFYVQYHCRAVLHGRVLSPRVG